MRPAFFAAAREVNVCLFFDMFVVQGQEGLWTVVPVLEAMNFFAVVFFFFFGFGLVRDLSREPLSLLKTMERDWS